MTTPEDLRAEADKADSEATELEAQARTKRTQAKILRAAAVNLDRLKRGTLTLTEMTSEHKAHISAARLDDEFSRAWRAAGFTSERDLAARLGVSSSFLSMVRRGRKEMPASRAEQIEQLIGYPRGNWRKHT